MLTEIPLPGFLDVSLNFVSRISDVELGWWNLSNVEIIYIEFCALDFLTLSLNLKFYLLNLNFGFVNIEKVKGENRLLEI